MAVTLEKIEKLIVDGNREIITRFDQKIDRLTGEVAEVKEELAETRRTLGDKIDRVDHKHDTNTQVLYGLLQDTRNELNERIGQVENQLGERIGQVEIKIDQVENRLAERIDRVETKLDLHMTQPAHN